MPLLALLVFLTTLFPAMPNPFGLNVFQATGLDAYTQAVNPNVMLFFALGDAKAYQAAHPQATVIHRLYMDEKKYGYNEMTMHRYPGATLRFLQERAAETPKAIYINLYCEPDLSQPGDLDRLVSETMLALQWAKANGVRVAAPHGAFYGLDERHWPTLLPLIRLIAANPTLFVYTVDEYFAGVAFSGVIDPAAQPDYQRGHVLPESWKASPVGGTWRYWHSGRSTVNLFLWLQARGEPIPPTVVTEYGCDRLGDVEPWLNTLAGTGDKGRGWQTLSAQYSAWYGPRGWSSARAYGQMMVAFWREVYSRWPQIRGVCIYCWGSNGDPNWEKFRVDGYADLYKTLGAYQVTTGIDYSQTVPRPATPGKAKIVVAKAGSGFNSANLRRGPSIKYAPPIGEVRIGDAVTEYRPLVLESADGYTWTYVQLNAALGGWMAEILGLDSPLPPITAQVTTPFLSQMGTGNRNNCGPAAVAMLLAERADGAKSPTVADIAGFLKKGDRYTTTDELITAFNAYATGAVLEKALGLDALRQSIDRGNPAIALVMRGQLGLTFGDFQDEHFVVVVAYGPDYFLIHDPFATTATQGAYLAVTAGNLAGALINQRVLTIAPLAPPPPPPEDRTKQVVQTAMDRIKLEQVHLQEIYVSLQSLIGEDLNA